VRSRPGLKAIDYRKVDQLRKVVTKARVKKALYKLLEKTPADKLTVKMIADDAADAEETNKEPVPVRFEGKEFSVEVVDAAEVLPENTELAVKEIDEKKNSKAYKGYYEDALRAVQDEKDGKDKITPDEAVSVKISYDEAIPVEDQKNVKIVHLAEDPDTGKVTPEVLDNKSVNLTVRNKEMTETTFEAESFSVYAVVYTLTTTVITDDGEDYEITVSYSDDAGIPEGAVLEAKEIARNSEEYAKYIKQAKKELNLDKENELTDAQSFETKISFARFFDISIVADGKKIEP